MNLRVDRDVENAPGLRLHQAYAAVRAHSKLLAAPLTAEDQGLQSMPDASPTKWHLAHTTWFFETLVLKAFAPSYRPFDPRFHELFNSYYEALGARHPRPQRGVLSRPTLAEVWDYRVHVDAAIERLLCASSAPQTAVEIISLGLQHEQQHQELILTDIKHAFSLNPMKPRYGSPVPPETFDQSPINAQTNSRMTWLDYPGGLLEIGHRGQSFAFDNETPCHPVWLQPYQLAS
ncbi:MAG: DinB family protein, partial [Gammaproteobacteria bacterium]